MTVALLPWGAPYAAWLPDPQFILPHINDWRPRIEKLAAQAIGLKLSTGSIPMQSSGRVPAVMLRDLRLFDRGRGRTFTRRSRPTSTPPTAC